MENMNEDELYDHEENVQQYEKDEYKAGIISWIVLLIISMIIMIPFTLLKIWKAL